MGAEFLFMEDNACPHRANIVDECLQSEDITRMDWPAYSPDLNPIEHVWNMVGRRIAARQPPPTCLLELRRALLNEWCNIPEDQIDNLILSMPRRCKVLFSPQKKGTPPFPCQARPSRLEANRSVDTTQVEVGFPSADRSKIYGLRSEWQLWSVFKSETSCI
ncbi:DDE_3 domain-containing protein [Trichonephila clavipes]|nr:DDE_3 domain-containing protein [Trichonephila clavipes]